MAKKILMVFLTVIAWLGLVVIIAGTFFSLYESINTFIAASDVTNIEREGYVSGHIIAFSYGFVGIILALIGGFIARPRYLGLALIVVGILYVISFAYIIKLTVEDKPYYIYFFRTHLGVNVVLALLPGVLAIVEGVIINRLRKRRQLQTTAT